MEKTDRLLLVLLVGSVLVLLVWMMRSASNDPGDGSPKSGYGLGPGDTAPPIRAEGWLNGDPITDEDLQGKVVVIDCWAYWCGPCMEAAPELISTYEQYRGRDVLFIGLTAEPATELQQTQKFLDATEIPWVNGYGAIETMTRLGGYYLPSVWVIGRDGKIVWNTGMDYFESLESAIDRALAEPMPNDNHPPAAAEAATN